MRFLLFGLVALVHQSEALSLTSRLWPQRPLVAVSPAATQTSALVYASPHKSGEPSVWHPLQSGES